MPYARKTSKRSYVKRRPAPVTRRKYTKTATRSKRSKATGYRPSTCIIRSPTAFADTTFVKLKYLQIFNLVHSTTLAASNMRGNSLFDPDFAVGGHQPRGFDQWAALYDRYCVYGCSIKVTFTTPAPGICCYIRPFVDGAIVVSTVDAAMELPYTQYKISSEGARRTIIAKAYNNTVKQFGITKNQQQDDEFSSLTTDNPLKQWFWQLAAQNVDLTTAGTTSAVVELVYYTKFTRRKTLLQS